MTDFTEFSRARMPGGYGGLSVDLVAPRQAAPYEFQPGTREAVDVALGLGRPLLVTGDPGVGKTTLGWAIAAELGLARGYHFVTRSTSEAQDLFYSYDALARFRDAQAAQPGEAARPATRYLAFQALGAAILDGSADAAVPEYLAAQGAGGWRRDPAVTRSVVVIDEIDKASRDFANDVLVEIEAMRFRVPELGLPTTPDLAPGRRPIVVVTSNSERALPDAFLRRCVYLHLEMPSPDVPRRIIARHLGDAEGGGDGGRQVDRLLEVNEAMRAQRDIAKRPGTSEIIDAARVLRESEPSEALRWRMAERALIKQKDDIMPFRKLLLRLTGIDNAPVPGAAG